MLLENINIEKILPQGHPFIMIDRVIDFKKGESLTAIKNVTANEWFFEHGPEQMRYLPESLIIEAAAQAAIILYLITYNLNNQNNFILGKIASKIKSIVYIGDQLIIKTKATKMMLFSGYMDIDLATLENIAKIRIYYKVNHEQKV